MEAPCLRSMVTNRFQFDDDENDVLESLFSLVVLFSPLRYSLFLF